MKGSRGAGSFSSDCLDYLSPSPKKKKTMGYALMKCVKGLSQDMEAAAEKTRQEQLEQTTQVKAVEAERTNAVLRHLKVFEAIVVKYVAVKQGGVVFNDATALRFDVELAKIVKEYKKRAKQ